LNVRRATVEDTDFIKSVYGHPDIWKAVSDDNTPDIEVVDFTPLLSAPTVFFLIPDAIGVFFYHPWNSTTYEMHSAVLPEHRGKGAMEGARLAGMWMFDNTPCQKIVTLVPVINIRARFLARRGGMVEEGRVTRSFLKDGVLVDQRLYAITKEVAKCH